MGLPVASDFCAQASAQHQEPLLATAAPETSVWLGVETNGAWPRNAFESSAVPDSVRDRLREWGSSVPGFRAQALRRPGQEGGGLTVVLALTGPAEDAVVQLEVPSIDVVAELDIPAWVEGLRAGRVPPGARTVERPMVWVCVHGRRDRCCAKFGAPVFEAARAVDGVDAWQTSHLGGHRFAATLLCLPKGACYGRVEASDVEPLVRSHVQDRVHALPLFRGRTCWSATAQAAVHFVRAHVGEMALTGFHPRIEGESDHGTRVRVDSPRGEFAVVVQRRALGGHAPPSCEKDPAPVRGWVQVAIEPELPR